MIEYRATIFKIGINPVTDPPDEVLEALFEQAGRTKGPIPVRGRLNGADFVQTLVRYNGRWRLYINGLMLSRSGLTVGDTANIELEYDARPRKVPMPEILKSALENNAAARSEFEKLPASRRKEIKAYIGSLKTDEARLRNVDRVISRLRGEITPIDNAMLPKET